MRAATPKLSWIEKAKETNKFHIQKLKQDPNWRIEDTAKALKRSLGGVGQDLLVASWCKTHEDELNKFEYLKDALEFIREKKAKMKIEEIE